MTMFVDLKAAFDSVDREVLIEAMREQGVRGGASKEGGTNIILIIYKKQKAG